MKPWVWHVREVPTVCFQASTECKQTWARQICLYPIWNMCGPAYLMLSPRARNSWTWFVHSRLCVGTWNRGPEYSSSESREVCLFLMEKKPGSRQYRVGATLLQEFWSFYSRSCIGSGMLLEHLPHICSQVSPQRSFPGSHTLSSFYLNGSSNLQNRPASLVGFADGCSGQNWASLVKKRRLVLKWPAACLLDS